MKQRIALVPLLSTVLFALVTVGMVRLGAQNYLATASQLKATFRQTLEYMSAAQLREFAAQIAAQWKQLDDLEAAATALDALPLTIEPARSRAAIATSESQAAQARSEAARRTFDNTFRLGMQSYSKAFGDYMERWGLPRLGGTYRTYDPAQMAAFEREGAPIEEMKIRLERTLTAEKGQAEALEATTRGKQTAAQRAGEELAGLQAALSTRTAAFNTLRVSTEAGISGQPNPGGFAALTPFPNNVAKPTDLKRLVNPVAGVNTNPLDQLRANLEKKENYHRDCFDDNGCSAGPEANGGPAVAVPPGVAQSPAGSPLYQEAKAAKAEATQRREEALVELRKIQRDQNATREQLEAGTKKFSKAMADDLFKTVRLESIGEPKKENKMKVVQ